MKTSPEHFTFTNHFNQSLLKNRIAMMNKRKSSWKAFGKYGLFIASIWVCAAFTKPYRTKVAAQIVEKVPELKLVLQPEIAPKPALRDFVLEKPQLTASKQDSVKLTSVFTNSVSVADTHQWVSATKYVVYKGNYLHFLITPKTTFEDLVKIRFELNRHELSLEILTWQMDSLGRYARKAEILVKGLSGPPHLIARGKDAESNPIRPIAVTLPIKKVNGATLFGSDKPQVQSLKDLAESDNSFANFDMRWSQSMYDILTKYRQKGIYAFPPTVLFTKKSLIKEDTPLFRHPFAIMTNSDNKEILKVNASLRKAKFRLNDSPALLDDIENISPDKFSKAIKYEVDDEKTNFHETYILVYTKP